MLHEPFARALPLGSVQARVWLDQQLRIQACGLSGQLDQFWPDIAESRWYYLFQKQVPLKNSDRVQTIYFFAKNPQHDSGEPLAEVPADRIVSETKTGMLVLKKKPAAGGG